MCDNFLHEVGDIVTLDDPIDIFCHGHSVKVIGREAFTNIAGEKCNVYTVQDTILGWTMAMREAKLIKENVQ